MQQRYYDPIAGIFFSVDPNTSGFNRYTYALSNPYSYTDPDGREEVTQKPTVLEPVVITGKKQLPASVLEDYTRSYFKQVIDRMKERLMRGSCKEKQISVGVSALAGFSPVVIPSGFVGGGSSIGITSNGSVFVQNTVTGELGGGIYAGVAVQAMVSGSETPLQSGVSHVGQADAAFMDVGVTVQGDATSGGIAGGVPFAKGAKLGAGVGAMIGLGASQVDTHVSSPLLNVPSNCGK